MLNIGCHLSASAGFLAMGRQITELGGNTFAFFTRNPRGGKARPVDEADIKAYTDFAKNTHSQRSSPTHRTLSTPAPRINIRGNSRIWYLRMT